MTASSNCLPIACTACISKCESPTEIRFAIASEFNWRCTSRKAWTFHTSTRSGKCRSNFDRAEMTRTCSNIGTTSGMYMFALRSTQPSRALVTIKTWPLDNASVSNCFAKLATARSWLRISARGLSFRKLVQSNVSSQSKIVTVWCCGGLCSLGAHVLEYERRPRYFARKSCLVFSSPLDESPSSLREERLRSINSDGLASKIVDFVPRTGAAPPPQMLSVLSPAPKPSASWSASRSALLTLGSTRRCHQSLLRNELSQAALMISVSPLTFHIADMSATSANP
mmetsp:Transcript_120981/g.349583  ORF Transcript_120981/g.349583 Transcript_120981/m.349583 type:complete len:283 (+) Transcript_120981:361-1209(+)